jgi:hypothetical protein
MLVVLPLPLSICEFLGVQAGWVQQQALPKMVMACTVTMALLLKVARLDSARSRPAAVLP